MSVYTNMLESEMSLVSQISSRNENQTLTFSWNISSMAEQFEDEENLLCLRHWGATMNIDNFFWQFLLSEAFFLSSGEQRHFFPLEIFTVVSVPLTFFCLSFVGLFFSLPVRPVLDFFSKSKLEKTSLRLGKMDRVSSCCKLGLHHQTWTTKTPMNSQRKYFFKNK